MRCGRGAAGARPHRPRAKQARTPAAPPAFFRHAAFGWRPRWSRRRTGDRFRGPAQAGRGRDRTLGAPSTPPLAADRASPAERGWRRRRRSSRPSRVGRGPPNLRPRVGRPRRDAAPSRWRDRSREGAQSFSRPQRRLVERRQCLSAGRAAVEQAAPVARADDRRRQAPLPPEIRLLVFGQTLRTELQPGGLPPPAPAWRKIGAQRQQERARPSPGERHAADRPGSEARAADQPIPHASPAARDRAGRTRRRNPDRAPVRTPWAAGRCQRPADAASSRAVRRALDPRRPANGPTGGRGSRGWTSIASNAGSVDLITAEPRAAASRAGAKAGHARAPRSTPL